MVRGCRLGVATHQVCCSTPPGPGSGRSSMRGAARRWPTGWPSRRLTSRPYAARAGGREPDGTRLRAALGFSPKQLDRFRDRFYDRRDARLASALRTDPHWDGSSRPTRRSSNCGSGRASARTSGTHAPGEPDREQLWATTRSSSLRSRPSSLCGDGRRRHDRARVDWSTGSPGVVERLVLVNRQRVHGLDGISPAARSDYLTQGELQRDETGVTFEPNAPSQALRARGHGHARTLRSVADRLLNVACAMLRNRACFDPHRAETAAALFGVQLGITVDF